MRFCSILVLSVILLSGLVALPVMAVQPSWTVAASPGIELTSVVISADGSTVVAGGDQLMALSADGKKLWSGWSGTALEISADGNYILTSQGQNIRLFDRQGFDLWSQPLGSTIRSISMSPDGLMIGAGGGRTIESWYNSGSGMGLNTTDTVKSIRVSPTRDQVIVTTGDAVRAFNQSLVPRWYDDGISPSAIGISSDGTRIVVQNGNHLRMYHGGGKLLWDRQIPGGNILPLVYSRDGSTIAVGRDDNTVVALDRDGNELWTAKMSFFAGGLGISDTGSVTAVGTLDNNLYFYDRNGTQLGTFTTKGPIRAGCVAVSGDGSLIAATDGSKVYGFSRILSPSPTPAPVMNPDLTMGNLKTPAVPPEPVNASFTSQPGLPGQSMPPSMTPAAGIPPGLCLIALVVVVLLSWKKTG